MNNDNLISVYTRQDAINDGIFVDVSEVAHAVGFPHPTAVTTNLFHTHIVKTDPNDTHANLKNFLQVVYKELVKQDPDSLYCLKVDINGVLEDVWVAVEAQSPYDHSLGINILLPEDY